VPQILTEIRRAEECDHHWVWLVYMARWAPPYRSR